MKTVPLEKIKDELEKQGFQIFQESAGMASETIRAEKVDVSSGRKIVVKLTTELRDSENSTAVVELAHLYQETNREGVTLSEPFRREFPRGENGAGGSHGEPGRITLGEHRGEHRGPPGEHGKK